MSYRHLALPLAAVIGLMGAGQSVAQSSPSPFSRFERTCLPDYEVPTVLGSFGYRNARIVDYIDTEHVKVIADTFTGRYEIIFDLCRGEIDERKEL